MTLLPKIVIFTGPPGSGKTSLSRFVGKEFCLPCINKDDIKEILFDNFTIEESLQSHEFGIGSVKLLFYVAERILVSGGSLILESNFEEKTSDPYFSSLWNKVPHESIQFVCKTDFDVLFNRFDTRSRSENRHPGHRDRGFTRASFHAYLEDKKYELTLRESKTVFLDTTGSFEETQDRIKTILTEFLGRT